LSDSPEQDHQLESRMREIRPSGSEGGGGLRASPYPYPRGRGVARVRLCDTNTRVRHGAAVPYISNKEEAPREGEFAAPL
jgi:hypothetical protein